MRLSLNQNNTSFLKFLQVSFVVWLVWLKKKAFDKRH